MSNPDETRLPENDRIKGLIPIHEIAAMMDSGDYSAEMLLQHLCAHWNRRDGWLPIESAPRDGSEFIVYCPPAYGIGHMASVCSWNDDGGFCVDELREPTHWRPLPDQHRANV